MTTADLNIAIIGNQQRTALQWFMDNAGQVRSWRDIELEADEGNRLATLAKGIYKPAYTKYALSIRQTLTSSYADKDVVTRPDGSWLYPYFQENPDPNARDQEATNRGLMNCLRDGVPIGVMIQTKPKPGVEYFVMGLGLVVDWKDGYFIIERYSAAPRHPLERSAARDRIFAELEAPPTPLPNVGAREWEIRQVLKRRGQTRFRMSLIRAYDGCCAITGCNAIDALEAAHIAPYNESINNKTDNGLLLRADLHTLFDLGLLAVNPEDFTVMLSPKLEGSVYNELLGVKVRLPQTGADRPSAQALNDHARWAGLI
ncbi:HNH endonuclease [Devosia ginsengisoli]|uniref:HNH endonuclease n=1 Tax=Devosia ginsengisoli TaxID=400770 RepID=UPI0026EC9D6B|nr:HNH endonuclease signature motif containing protein [Devosia ginsengisoli]MCR6670729.1 HNH endonuclease [Devosia ginsengisoli]